MGTLPQDIQAQTGCLGAPDAQGVLPPGKGQQAFLGRTRVFLWIDIGRVGEAPGGHAKGSHSLQSMDMGGPAQQDEAGPQTPLEVAKVGTVTRPWEAGN